MRDEIEKAFFYKKERRLILDFKELKRDRFFISFYGYLRKKTLLRKLIYLNLVSVKNGFKYSLIDLRYDQNISKFELTFKVFKVKGGFQ